MCFGLFMRIGVHGGHPGVRAKSDLGNGAAEHLFKIVIAKRSSIVREPALREVEGICCLLAETDSSPIKTGLE
jgi:hypothetical protein